MTLINAYRLFISNSIPLADIRVVFNDYFKRDFDSLIIHEDDEIDDDLITDTLEKLKAGYPACYLAGFTSVDKLRFYLDENVLIPRIETEDFVINYLLQNYDFSYKKILDLCTGSGLIASLIKKKFPTAAITGSDISLEALNKAKQSAKYNNLDLNFIKSDYFKNIDESYDFIISNPPYIEKDSKDVNSPFEPALALFTSTDGLDSYREIFKNCKSHLKGDKTLFLECESTNIDNTVNLFKSIEREYQSIEVIKDLYGRNRYLKIVY